MKKRALSLILAAALFALCACSCSIFQDGDTAPTHIQTPVTLEPTTAPPTEPDPVDEEIAAMSLEEKVGQLFLVTCPDEYAAQYVTDYHLGGVVLFGRHVEGKTADELKDFIAGLQSAAKVPLLIAADEEGGTVVRVSDNPNLRADGGFWSPKDYFSYGGWEAVENAETEKAELLTSLGLNVNLAPVCDITADTSAFMYLRSFSESAQETSEFITKTVAIYKAHHLGSTLKHFPGYGENVDTHTGMAYDDRSLEALEESDLLPFKAGVDAGADAIMVSHNIVSAFDADFPASLSAPVHAYIRDKLGFDGVVMTDDLAMEAITQYTGSDTSAVFAVKNGNDVLCCSDFTVQYPAVLAAVQNGEISEEQINTSVKRVLNWKQSLGLI